MTQEGIVLASRSDWSVLRPLLFESIGQTLEMVLITLVVGGFLGLVLGVVLYGTRPGNLFENAVLYRILDVIVNIIRPIPFIIFLAAMQPLTIKVVGNAFLHAMVRTIVGTLVMVGRGLRKPDWVREVLEARDRTAAGENAPAAGLVFWKVQY